jgi:hypothetical protein
MTFIVRKKMKSLALPGLEAVGKLKAGELEWPSYVITSPKLEVQAKIREADNGLSSPVHLGLMVTGVVFCYLEGFP